MSAQAYFVIGYLVGSLWTLDCVAFHLCRSASWWGVLPGGGFYFWWKERR